MTDAWKCKNAKVSFNSYIFNLDKFLRNNNFLEDTNKTGSKKSKLDAKRPCEYYKSNELDNFNLRILVKK